MIGYNKLAYIHYYCITIKAPKIKEFGKSCVKLERENIYFWRGENLLENPSESLNQGLRSGKLYFTDPDLVISQETRPLAGLYPPALFKKRAL